MKTLKLVLVITLVMVAMGELAHGSFVSTKAVLTVIQKQVVMMKLIKRLFRVKHTDKNLMNTLDVIGDC